jgi:hypothetical protein
MKNPGKLFEIIAGTYKGKFCIAYDKEQFDHYYKHKRLVVRYFDDKEFKVPTRYEDTDGKYPEKDGKKLLGIENIANLKSIGFTD